MALGTVIATGIFAGMTYGAVASLVITIASTAYQIVQAKKMRRAARAAAEARKGFELVAEGEVRPIPIVYGRALIGGTRVYHNISSSYRHITTNANKSFLTGPGGSPAGSYEATNWENNSTYTVAYDAIPAKYLDQDYNGSKNEFLFIQQILCQGPINAAYDVIFEGSQFLDDPSLGNTEIGSAIYKLGQWNQNDDPKAALRLDYHYNGGYDAITSNNFGERKNATFPNLAYFSAVIRLDRDNPQFNKVPDIQTLIEGRKVRTFANSSTLSEVKSYSNNPVLCLLDYLLDPVSGKNLSISEIDLPSFYSASLICNTIVKYNAPVGGNIWKPIDESRNISTRNIPLYECNIIIDTTKPIRENIESILSTMGDARLIWSEGKYKLSLQYPSTNANINLAATLTDNDLVHDKPVEISWPSSSERLNSCTVRFNNESQNFKEDSVSWPFKTTPPNSTQTINRGIGGKRYIPVSDWPGESAGASFLNNYAVWDGGLETTLLSWKFIAVETGNHSIKFAGDNEIIFFKILSGNTVLFEGSGNNWEIVYTGNVTLTKDQQYTILISASNANSASSGDIKGAAATLTTPSGNVSWSTRSETYDSFITTVVSDEVYQQMLSEDNGIQLDSDMFAEGITDYYHALAKAEELVRTSRTAIGIKFQYIIKNKYLEPGDIIKLQSETLNVGEITDFFIRINEVKILENNICEITGARFDYTQLAWNQEDDEYIKPQNLYSFILNPPTTLTFVNDINLIEGSIGSLIWDNVPEPTIRGYILYFHLSGDLDNNGRPIFKEIGRARESPFYVPNLGEVSGIFGVASYTSAQVSRITSTDPNNAIVVFAGIIPPKPVSCTIEPYGDFENNTKLTWEIPLLRSNGSEYNDHGTTKIFRAQVIDPEEELIFTLIQETDQTSFIDLLPVYGNIVYKLQFKSNRNFQGPLSDPFSTNISGIQTKTLYLRQTGHVFIFKDKDSITSNSPFIEITAITRFIIQNPVFVAKAYNESDEELGVVTLTAVEGEPKKKRLTTEQFLSLNTATDKVKYVEIVATAEDLTDRTTIFRVDGGTDALTAFLTNPAHLVSANENGEVLSYESASGLMQVYKGATLLTTPLVSFSVVNHTGFTVAYPTIPAGISVNATTGAYSVTNNISNTSDIATVTIRATLVSGETVDQVFSLSKVKNAYPLVIEYSQDGSTNWHLTFAEGDIYARWRTNPNDDWSGPFKIVGEDGQGVRFVFTRSDTLPPTPAGSTPETDPLQNWDDAPPVANGKPLWASTATFDINNQIVGVWSTPVQIEGDPGADAPLLFLSSTSMGYVYEDVNATTTSSPDIVFTANLQNITGTVTFVATAYTSTNENLGNLTLAPTNNTVTISGTLFNSKNTTTPQIKTASYVKVTSTLGTLIDTVTVYRVNGGSDALIMGLTNELHSVAADNAGVVASGAYTGASGTALIAKGAEILSGTSTPSVTFSLKGYTGFTTTYPTAQSGITVNSNGTYSVTNNISSTSDTATVEIEGTLSTGQKLTKIFTIIKSKAGKTGQSNHRVYKAAAANSPPQTPSNTTDGATPDQWSPTPVALTAGQAQWQSDGTTAVGSSTTTWSTPYQSYLKVDTLEAITVNTGNLTATGSITIGTSGHIKSSGGGYNQAGIFLGYDTNAYKFSIGDGANNLTYDGTTLSVPAGRIVGTIATSQLANNSVTPSKFADGTEPITVVTAVPNTKSTNTIFNSTNNKLYRWDSTANAYTLAIPAADITGELSDSQINSISAAKLTGTINANTIANGSISGTKFASGIEPISVVNSISNTKTTNTVFNSTDGKLYRWDSTTNSYVTSVSAIDVTGQLTNEQINSIAAAKLTGTINASAIADGSIAGTKFASGIEPISIVNSISNTKTTNTVFNTTDGKLYRWNGTSYIVSVPAVDITGQLSDTQINSISAAKLTGTISANAIADGSISGTKFASSIEAISNVTSVPNTKSTNIIFNTTDNKLYRWNGTAYVASVPSVDITGQLTDSQINAISAAKLTGTISANSIADGSISGTKFASSIEPITTVSSIPNVKSTNTIFNTNDNKLYRWNGSAYVASIPAVDISGQLTDSQINAISAAKLTGTLSANAIADGSISGTKFASSIEPITVVTAVPNTKSTNTIFNTTDGKLYRWTSNAYTLSIPAADITGQLTDSQINAVAAAKLTGSITSTQITDNAITTQKILAGAVTTASLAADAITAEKIAANAITAVKISAGAITTAKIAANAITATEISAGAITTGKIAAGAISTSELAANAVTTAKIAADAITATQISAGAITTAKIAANAITASEIAAGTITGAKLVTGTITSTQIAANAITATQIAADAIESGKIKAGAVSTNELAANAITTAKIAASAITSTQISSGAVDTNQLAANAITAEKISANAITAVKIDAGAITTAKIAANAITAALISANAVEAGKIAAGAISATELAANAVSSDKIAANAITSLKISSGAVETNQLAANAITAEKIAANAITAVKIAAGAIETSKIAANAITTALIAADAVTAAQIVAGAINTSELAANAVTTAKIAADAVTATQISAGAIETNKLAANAITAEKIAADAVTAVKIAAGAIETNKIAANAITSAKIAADAVEAGQIAAGAVSTSELAANAITAEKIAADAVTAVKIAAGAIETNKLAANAITAEKIAAGAITTTQIATGAITAAKMAANSVTANSIEAGAITAAKLNVTNLSAISANLGTVNAGSISGTANIDITGSASFQGLSSISVNIFASSYTRSTCTTLNRTSAGGVGTGQIGAYGLSNTGYGAGLAGVNTAGYVSADGSYGIGVYGEGGMGLAGYGRYNSSYGLYAITSSSATGVTAGYFGLNGNTTAGLTSVRIDATAINQYSLVTSKGIVVFGGNDSAGEFRVKSSVDISNSGYATIFRQDTTNFYMLLTDSGSAAGSFNAKRPFTMGLSNGFVTLGDPSTGATVNKLGLANMTISNGSTSAPLSVNKPGTNSTNTWLELWINGSKYWVPIWAD